MFIIMFIIIVHYITQQLHYHCEQKMQEDEKQKKNTESQQITEEMTTEEIEAYDTMLYKWRQFQRQSLKIEQSPQHQIYTYNPDESVSISLQKPVSQIKDDIFSRYTPEILNYLRTKFILEELIEPIHEQKMLDMTVLSNLQFMYLIIFRAWCEINTAQKTFQANKKVEVGMKPEMAKQSMTSPKNKVMTSPKNKVQKSFSFEFATEDKNLKYLVDPIYKIEKKIENFFNFYHKGLVIKEKSLRNRLKAFKNMIFNFSKKSNRDRFMNGFEGIDFTKEEQIQFTSVEYIPNIVAILKSGDNISKEKALVSKLQNYKKILTLKLPQIESFDDFQILKNTIIKQWQQNQISSPEFPDSASKAKKKNGKA